MFANAQTGTQWMRTMNALDSASSFVMFMPIHLILDPVAAPVMACFGVVCPCRGHCRHYVAVSDTHADPHTLVTCHDGESFPLFVDDRTARPATGDRRDSVASVSRVAPM